MRRGDPDAGRGMHGLEQVGRQLAQRVVKCGHGLRREREPGVGISDDGADGHVLGDRMSVYVGTLRISAGGTGA